MEQIGVIKLADQFGGVRVVGHGFVVRHIVTGSGNGGEVLADHLAAQGVRFCADGGDGQSHAGRLAQPVWQVFKLLQGIHHPAGVCHVEKVLRVFNLHSDFAHVCTFPGGFWIGLWLSFIIKYRKHIGLTQSSTFCTQKESGQKAAANDRR